VPIDDVQPRQGRAAYRRAEAGNRSGQGRKQGLQPFVGGMPGQYRQLHEHERRLVLRRDRLVHLRDADRS
jgi:hypothetical protein